MFDYGMLKTAIIEVAISFATVYAALLFLATGEQVYVIEATCFLVLRYVREILRTVKKI